MVELNRVSVMTHEEVIRPEEQSDLRGPYVVSILDDFSKTLETISRKQARVVTGSVQCAPDATWKVFKAFGQTANRSIGCLDLTRLVVDGRRIAVSHVENLIGGLPSARKQIRATVRGIAHLVTVPVGGLSGTVLRTFEWVVAL
ncbi:MAG: hypothetical protein F4045_11950 [Chloroflexi bacterium]|nr:hypothetical protein [Chloroflexota bacterium]MYK35780.1 hypothetical protein [Chloroflexota bacterium]